jgi:hypothetical protein
MRDTSPKQQDDYYARLKRLTPEQRLRLAARLTTAVRRLAETGIRERHPLATDAEVRVRLAVRLYGRAAGQRLFGMNAVPPDAICRASLDRPTTSISSARWLSRRSQSLRPRSARSSTSTKPRSPNPSGRSDRGTSTSCRG